MGPLAGAGGDVRDARAGAKGYAVCAVLFVVYFIAFALSCVLTCSVLTCFGFCAADCFRARFG